MSNCCFDFCLRDVEWFSLISWLMWSGVSIHFGVCLNSREVVVCGCGCCCSDALS